MTHDVIIIGGGLAGSAAAIGLARRGHRVLLLERRARPAPKLCGEFLSTEVAALLGRLGVLGAAHAAGAHPIRRAVVTAPGGAAYRSRLPGTALGVSRLRLDALLFEEARAAGAEARYGAAARAVEGTLHDGFEVRTGGAAFRGRLVLGAYGKRSLLDRKLERAFLSEDSPQVAFKAHYAGLRMPGVIELHAFPGGYCGLSRVEEGRVNVCWIARAEQLKAAGGRPEDMIEQSLARNPALLTRLWGREPVSDSFLAIAQVSLAPKGAVVRDVLMLGDAAGMIAPLCGDGMAMALHSAELAVPLVSVFLEGEMSAGNLRAAYPQRWKSAFARRLRLGRWIHRASVRPGVAEAVVQACRWAPGLGGWLIRNTRG